MRINNYFRRLISGLTLLAFITASLPCVYSQTIILSPAPGTAVELSERYAPPLLVGIKLDARQPFMMGFVFDQGQDILTESEKRQEYLALISYFLTSLTIPNHDMWVNLAPYEAQRIMPVNFSLTGMGRDLLAQDYFLKQITASLLDPRTAVGKVFWEKVYAAAQDQYGTTDIPVDTFNKVWIIPDRAAVYEANGTALTVESHLKVMLQEDYAALDNSQKSVVGLNLTDVKDGESALSSAMIREVVLPVLEQEVNEGKSFARLRQIYSAMILATWFKQRLRESLLGQVYADRSKVAGVEVDDPQAKEKIYQKYLDAYKAGVFNFVQEERDPLTDDLIPRKYFSGGIQAPDKVKDGSPTQAEALRDALQGRMDLAMAELSPVDRDILKYLKKLKEEQAAAQKRSWNVTFKGMFVFFGFEEWGRFLSQFFSGTSLIMGTAVLTTTVALVVLPALENPSANYSSQTQPAEQIQNESLTPTVRSTSSTRVRNDTMTLAKTVAAMEAKYRAGSVDAYNWLLAQSYYNPGISSSLDQYAYEYCEAVIAQGYGQGVLNYSDERIKRVLTDEGVDIFSVIERARNGSTSDFTLLAAMVGLGRPGLDESVVTSILSTMKFWDGAINLWATGKGSILRVKSGDIPSEISEQIVDDILSLDRVSRQRVMDRLPEEISRLVKESSGESSDDDIERTISGLANRNGVLNTYEVLLIASMKTSSGEGSGHPAFESYLERGG